MSSSMVLWAATWTVEGEHVNPRLRRLWMLMRMRRISRRSGSNSAVWASSSSRAKPFSIFSIYLTPFQNGVSLRKGLHEGRVLTIPQMSDLCLAHLSDTRHRREPLAHRIGATHNVGC